MKPRFGNRYGAPRKSGGGRDYFRPETGQVTAIRLLPFKHKITEGDIALNRYHGSNGDSVGDMAEELFVGFRQHFLSRGQAPSLCGKIRGWDGRLTGSCEHCASASALMDAGGEDFKIGKGRSARERFAVNVYIPDEGRIAIYEASVSLYNWFCSLEQNPEYENVQLWGADGRDILIDYDKSRDVSTIYQFQVRDSSKSVAIDLSEVNGGIKDLFALDNYVPPAFIRHVTDYPPTEQDGSSPSTAEEKKPTPPPASKQEAPKTEEVEEEEIIEEEEDSSPSISEGDYVSWSRGRGKVLSVDEDEAKAVIHKDDGKRVKIQLKNLSPCDPPAEPAEEEKVQEEAPAEKTKKPKIEVGSKVKVPDGEDYHTCSVVRIEDRGQKLVVSIDGADPDESGQPQLYEVAADEAELITE